MVLVFVHGWSVRDTETYGRLPERLQREMGAAVEHVYLGKYVSFDDGVTMDDIARAFDAALREKLFDAATGQWRRFACITHSTGGPLARLWMTRFYGSRLGECPLSHLVMLAPPNHGSALAQLGKSRLSRLRFFLDGAEPGTGVLDFLELGSDENWDLNRGWLDFDGSDAGVWVFSLTGQRIDRKLYDHLNTYTGEAGSDGVVRAASANLNYQMLQLVQKRGARLELESRRQSRPSAFGIVPGASHFGDHMGIQSSVPSEGPHPVLAAILGCLSVRDAADYEHACRKLEDISMRTQAAERIERVPRLLGETAYETHAYSMVTFRLLDDRGAELDDYDLLLTAGPEYSPDELPSGFCLDRQRNRRRPGHLTYYVDHERLEAMRDTALEGRLGLRLLARPSRGLAYYEVAEFRSEAGEIAQLLRPNETTLVEAVLARCVDARVFELSPRLSVSEKISRQPTGRRAA